MAVALGLTPSELDAIAISEPELFEALVRAVRDKWTPVEELLAGIYELTHANYRALLALGGVKERDLPKPVRVPRPGAAEPAKKASSSEFAQWIRRRRGG
jgi:hypothetical protein